MERKRSDSVNNGLNALPKSCEFAHVHDCARPMIQRETIALLIKNVEQSKATAVARPVTNTIRKSFLMKHTAEQRRLQELTFGGWKPSISSKKMAYGRLR